LVEATRVELVSLTRHPTSLHAYTFLIPAKPEGQLAAWPSRFFIPKRNADLSARHPH